MESPLLKMHTIIASKRSNDNCEANAICELCEGREAQMLIHEDVKKMTKKVLNKTGVAKSRLLTCTLSSKTNLL